MLLSRVAPATKALALSLALFGVVLAPGCTQSTTSLESSDRAAQPAESVPSATASAPAAPTKPASPVETAHQTVLREFRTLLESGQEVLESARDFQGILHKHERIRGTLGDPEDMHVKMRREPKAVYLRSDDDGGEVLWRKGQDEGKLLLHPGGWKGKLMPLMRIDADHKLVKAFTRRSLDRVGLWSMGEELRGRLPSLDKPEITITSAEGHGPDGREYISFRILDAVEQEDDHDHITVVFVDRERKIAVGCEVYGWPESEGAEPPLLESYFYSNIEFNVGLTDRDFDPANPAYGFVPAKTAVNGKE